MKLTAAIIVKDEAEHLRRCLGSIREVTSEIVVVDTGSTDDSVAVAAAAGALVLHRPWDGRFSPPRNLGLDHATGDWILYIDADEEFQTRDASAFLATLDAASDANVLALQTRFIPKLGQTPYWEWRLWRNHPEIRFRGVMHEGITEAITELLSANPSQRVGRCEPSLIVHHGYEGDQTAKHRRNLPLLEEELKRTPQRTYLWNHLGRCLEGLGRQEEAFRAWEKAIDIVRSGGVRDQLDGLSYSDLIMRRVARGEDITQLLSEALPLFPGNVYLTWAAALQAFAQARHEEVLVHTGRLLALTENDTLESGLSYDARILGEWPLNLRGNAMFQLGRFAEAANAYAEAQRLNPHAGEYKVRGALARARLTAQVSTPT